MKTFSDFVVETFNSNPVKWVKDGPNDFVFFIDGITYVTTIKSIPYNNIFGSLVQKQDPDFDTRENKIYDVSFYIEGQMGEYDNFGISNTGNQFVVFSTVMDIMQEWLKSHPETTYFTFSAMKKGGFDSSREKIYERMVKKYVGKLFDFYLKKSNLFVDGASSFIVKIKKK